MKPYLLLNGELKELFAKKGDHIAAFMAEPIQGEAGVIVPDDNYWPEVRKLCDQYNILLALDTCSIRHIHY